MSSFAKAVASFFVRRRGTRGVPGKKNRRLLCAGAVVREGRIAPVQAPAWPAQLSTEKHICSETFFFKVLPVVRQGLLFTMIYRPPAGPCFGNFLCF